jgi:hypothetical protein
VPEIRARNSRKGIARSDVCVICAMPIARQWVGKHILAEAYCGTVGRPFLGSGVVNTHTNCWRQCFLCGLCKVDIREASSKASSCGRMRMRIEGMHWRPRTRLVHVLVICEVHRSAIALFDFD